MIRFLHPEMLWLLALLPILALWWGRRGEAVAIRYSTVSNARRLGAARQSHAGRWMSALRLLVLGLMIVGLARPQLVRGTTEVEASGIDILLAVDVSGSMEALDFEIDGKPVNRIEVVKAVVSKFIEDRPNDRIGLVAFAGRPYLVSPLTLDHDWLQQRLEQVQIGMVEDGTAIGSAIASGVNRLREQDAKSRIVILLTDGMNNAGKVQPTLAAEAAEALSIKVYTIGTGTRGEAPIPVQDHLGQRQLVMAQVDIDEETLTKVATMTGARYYRATDTDSLAGIYDEINALETTTQSMKNFAHHNEIFGMALLPALLLLGVELSLGQTRYRRLP
ncbi:MAG: VWA domain-containing protein [Actinomycetia bacterium]|jgi:Ca-activated chloride channel family protein|nr:VWA domain-containing protein [Actinomycetes bacterium]